MEINLHDETPEKEFASLQIKPYIEGSVFFKLISYCQLLSYKNV